MIIYHVCCIELYHFTTSWLAMLITHCNPAFLLAETTSVVYEQCSKSLNFALFECFPALFIYIYVQTTDCEVLSCQNEFLTLTTPVNGGLILHWIQSGWFALPDACANHPFSSSAKSPHLHLLSMLQSFNWA